MSPATRTLPRYVVEPLEEHVSAMHDAVQALDNVDRGHELLHRVASMFRCLLELGWTVDEISRASLMPRSVVELVVQDARRPWWPSGHPAPRPPS